MMEEIFLYVFLFVLGTVFGSFGSVLLRRLSGRVSWSVVKSVLFGSSSCPECENRLRARDLIPVISWMRNRGKCRFCGIKISTFYPLLEMFSGASFAFSLWIVFQYIGASYADMAFWINLVFFIIINRGLVLLIFGDLLFYELNIYVWVFLVLFAIFSQFFHIVGDFKIAFLGGVVFFSIFYLIYVFSKFYVRVRLGMKDMEGFGGGDVMVAFLMGLLLPFILSFNGLVLDKVFVLFFYYLLLSSLLGIVFYLIMYFFSKGKYGQAIPFLPAMIVSFWGLLLYADVLMDVFSKIYG